MNSKADITRGEEKWRRKVARSRSPRRLPPTETIIAILAGLVLWYVIALFTPDYILPQLDQVGARIWELFTTPSQLGDWAMTLYRVLLGLVSSFVIGVILGMAMGKSQRFNNVAMPYLQVIQGIPSLAWVMICTIWFQDPELRVWFLMLMVTLPSFAFQTKDSFSAIPKELRDMAQSLRPRRSRLDMFRTVTLPSIVPDLLTAWKITLGLGTRVVLIAEFAGTQMGVGIQLRNEQAQLRMDGVIAWTAALVIFVLIVQKIIELIERRLLRYRPGGDLAPVAENPQDGADTPGEPRTAAAKEAQLRASGGS